MICSVFWWLWDYKRIFFFFFLLFFCFVQILSYDTVIEGKAKLQIGHSRQKEQNFSFKDLSVKDKCHVHSHSRVFHCLQVAK